MFWSHEIEKQEAWKNRFCKQVIPYNFLELVSVNLSDK